MHKNQAIELFGTTLDLARALKITRQAIYQWPEILPQRVADEVIGAAIRLGKSVDELPEAWRKGAA